MQELNNWSWKQTNVSFNPKRHEGGGWFNSLVRRTPAISHRVILWSQNFSTLSIIIPTQVTICTGFPEIQQRPSRDPDFLGSKIAKSIFFQLFYTKVPKFYFKSEWQLFSAFFWGVLCFCSFKIEDFSAMPWPRPLWRPPEAAISTSATSIGYQILAKDLSFHMRLCLLL